MEIYKNVIHYPTLKTMLLIEKILKNADTIIEREELKRRLPVKIMHQTLNLILEYLEERGMILDSHKGILWIYNPSPKLKGELEKAELIKERFDSKLELKRILPIIIKILKKSGVKKAGLFGSYSRGEATQESDVDILVEFKKKISLFDLVRVERELREALNKKVDLITYNSLNHLIKESVLKEEKRII